MRKRIAAAVLSAVISAWAGIGVERAMAVPAAAAADKATDVPVKQVVLYSSGVGYFEHFGSVTGDGSTELRFRTAQINDVLKSLVLQDMDKGKVGVITYPSQAPLSKTLGSFQVDITNNPSLHDILEQLRGAKVTVVMSVGGEKVTGIVLGVEKKEKPVGEGPQKKVVETWQLNLLVGASIKPVALEEVRDLQLDDPQIRDELAKALTALAAVRDQDKKPVSISFRGKGERRIRIGYVVEAPVWKVSYRLLLDVDADKKPGAGGDAKPQAAGGGAAGADKAGVGGNLQGWAIVENQTESDWQDVQLTLVSGRPIGFIQDLYTPLYATRPVVQPELYAGLRPQVYEGGIARQSPAQEWGNLPGADEKARRDANAKEEAYSRAVGGARPSSPAAEGQGRGGEGKELKDLMAKMDPGASVSSAASATRVGELFQYTVGAVSLPRQKSAMIPVVTDPIEVEKLSIYNQSVLPKNPLYGARVKNTTGKHLLSGPVTVLSSGSYAGDARISDLPPGQERLISYGIDQQVMVQAQNNKQESAVQTGKIVKGVLHLTRKQTASQEYLAENKGDKSKTLMVEHPRRGGWTLVEPAKAAETTDVLYRFKDALEPAKPKKLTVREEVVTGEEIAILPMDLGQIEVYLRTGPIPQAVKDALAQAGKLKAQLVDTQRQIQDRVQQINLISQEQSRIRENMKTVAQNTEYYTRLLKKLDEQETKIESLQKEQTALQAQMVKERKALEDYLNGLTIG